MNLSYVFTASQRFMDTLQSVVKGLHRAGFSDRDYRAIDAAPAPPAKGVQPELAGLFSEPGKPADSLAVSDPSPAGEPTSTQGDVPGVSPDWEQAASRGSRRRRTQRLARPSWPRSPRAHSPKTRPLRRRRRPLATRLQPSWKTR